MATAKIITDGNTQMVVLPENFHFDCSEVELQKVGAYIQIAPARKNAAREELIPASDEEVNRLSDELMKENAVAYRELAK